MKTGLSTFSLRDTNINSLDIFHKKMMKSILRLSVRAPTCSLYFLVSELPIKAQLHKDVFSLFYNVWANPKSKIHELVKYLLEISNEKSHTWCVHVKHLCKMYDITDPLSLMHLSAPSKEAFKQYINTKILIYHERDQREKSKSYKSMKYLNTAVLGLSGTCHPAIQNVFTSNEVQIMRIHLKFLSGDYLSNEKLSRQGNHSPICELCELEEESYCHIITRCPVLNEPRIKLMKEIIDFCDKNAISFIHQIFLDNEKITQFVLDPTSLNLPLRMNPNDRNLPQLFSICRNLCNSLHNMRMRKKKENIYKDT